MKFLCGRPSCGKESTATLQIDALTRTVSLVDPRVSRDGIPLCARHADATTPPLGWTMNDLRTRARSLAVVPDDDAAAPTSTPPRVRPDNDDRNGRRMSRRQSIAERAKRLDEEPEDTTEDTTEDTADQAAEQVVASADRTVTKEVAVTKEIAVTKETAVIDLTDDRTGQEDGEGPSSRPSRRRENPATKTPAAKTSAGGDSASDDGDGAEDDKFPWHFQFDDDEPEELQASTPLLSRAFRATTG